MKRKNLFNLLMILGLMLALGGGISMARQAQAQEPGPQGQSSIQVAVGNGFTYQGRLLDGGSPVDVACDFQFSLWTDSLTGSQVGSTQTASSVDVDDGYFSAPLDFGASAFEGDTRYLQIAVRSPAGSGAYTTLSGRVALTAAPYAHSLRPGAVIASDSAGQLGSVLYVEDTYTGVFISAAFEGKSTQGTGVHGLSTSGYGVEGTSATGNGVYGEATAASGTNYGVYGKTNSPTGHGVYGTSPSTNFLYAGVTGANTGGGAGAGVYGYSLGGYGVHGRATGGTGVYGTGSTTGTVGIATSGSGTTYGVYGRNATFAGAGVYGESSYSSGIGVRGYSAAGTGVGGYSTSGNGVRGSSTSGNGVWGYSTSGHAIYSEGDTHINGDLTWSTRTGYVAVSAAAFRPQDEGYEYTNHGYQLGTSTTDSEYYAHVQLPHGVNVTKVTFYWYDTFGGLIDARCRLYRNDMANNAEQQMAEMWSFGNSGDGSSDTSAITYPDIDNEHYSYYLEWVLDSSLWGYGVVITYEYTEPY